MGVRGLTRYIATKAELYLKPYELHDCNLVIDGDNLTCSLYKDVAGKNSAFGGDYDAFYRSVVEFFHVLSECNIQPYVLMDGGYERKKLRTVWQRLRGKIASIKRIDPNGSRNLALFPLMMREVFIDALRDCGVPVMRCVFEADEELAALARKLNCPVLSYDSDFYIYNVKYIPLVTLTMRAIRKRVKSKANQDEGRKLTRSRARHLEKRAKADRRIENMQVNAAGNDAPKNGKTYKYLDCCLYKMENLLEGSSLSKEKLPLFAALLGNDYIARSAFKEFYAQMKPLRIGKKPTKQYKRIQKILLWLKHETEESAIQKIVGSLKKRRRYLLLRKLGVAIEGYSTDHSESYTFFSSQYDLVPDACESDERSEDEDEESEIEDQEEEELEEAESDDEVEEEKVGVENDSGDVGLHKIEPISDKRDQLKGDSDSCDEREDEEDDEEESNIPLHLPTWFKQRLYAANLSRFFVDLVHLRIYINNPQIEHFMFHDCNEISLPILQYIFVLLHNISGDEENHLYRIYMKTDDEAEEFVPYLRYLTRVPRISNIHTVRYPIGPPPVTPFDPIHPDPKLFQAIFHSLELDSTKLFTEIARIPSDLRLYSLALIYWIHKTPHADLIHLHALLICLVVLRTIDSKVEPIRGERAFQKRFGKIISKEKQLRAKEQEEGVVRKTRPEIESLPAPDRIKLITKVECLLVQESLLKHFHMPEIFKKKYDTFSTTTLHGFSEFQSVVFNLRGLNVLLGEYYECPKMAQSFCGMFLYNMYNMLTNRIDVKYYVQHYIFQQSPVMYEFYEFLWNWCDQFIPTWQRQKDTTKALSKSVLKKKRAAARKKEAALGAVECEDPNVEMVEQEEDDTFYDLNNKFCALVVT